MVYVLMNIEQIELVVIGFVMFFAFLGLVTYGARLEQRYKNLEIQYRELEKDKEKK